MNQAKQETFDDFMKRQGTPVKPLTKISQKSPAAPSNPARSKPVEELIKESLGRR